MLAELLESLNVRNYDFAAAGLAAQSSLAAWGAISRSINASQRRPFLRSDVEVPTVRG